MSCNVLLKDLGYECRDISENLSLLISPFSRGDDGELAGVYVHEISKGCYRVSDGGDSLSHALIHGARVNANRTQLLERLVYREGVELSDTGEIHSLAEPNDLSQAINRVLSTSIEIGHYEKQWLSSARKLMFRDRVGEFLDQTYPEVERNAQVRALSGHQIALSFVVRGANNVAYIETVGRKQDRVNWASVYKVAGIMADLREHDAKRCVIVEDIDDDETKQAETVLSDHANVLPFSKRNSWYQHVA